MEEKKAYVGRHAAKSRPAAESEPVAGSASVTEGASVFESTPIVESAPAAKLEPVIKSNPVAKHEPVGENAPAVRHEPAGDVAKHEPAGENVPVARQEPAGDHAPAAEGRYTAVPMPAARNRRTSSHPTRAIPAKTRSHKGEAASAPDSHSCENASGENAHFRGEGMRTSGARRGKPASNKSDHIATSDHSATSKHTAEQRPANFSLLRLIAAVLLLGVLVLGIYLIFFAGSSTSGSDSNDGANGSTTGDTAQQTLENRVSFAAVGDNLPEISLAAYADDSAGGPSDGLYDFTPIYSTIKPYIESADLAYINFEVHAGGDDIGPRGWPSFNTMSTMVDAVHDTGFDLIASASNHSYDWAEQALVHSANLWKQKPVLFTGTAGSPEDAAAIQTYEKNGIVFSLLNYTYGVNGYDESEIPAYAINYMHEDRIRADIAAARELADVVIVAMHWGTENQFEPDETQRYYAQLIADAGADLILGSHPHVIGPLAWLEGAGGNKTLVAYSLGNFISKHEIPLAENELGGMLQCDFVKTEQGVAIENVRWTPVVNHTEAGNHRVYALKDYTPELAARHTTFAGTENAIGMLKEITLQVIGPDFTLDYE